MSSKKPGGSEEHHRLRTFFKTLGRRPWKTYENMYKFTFSEIPEFLERTEELGKYRGEEPATEKIRKIETEKKSIEIYGVKSTDPRDFSDSEKRDIRTKNLQYRDSGMVAVPQDIRNIFGKAHSMKNHQDPSFYLIGDQTWARRNEKLVGETGYETVLREKEMERALGDLNGLIENAGLERVEEYLEDYFPEKEHREFERVKKFVEETYLISEEMEEDSIYIFADQEHSERIEQYFRDKEEGELEFRKDYEGLGEVTVGGHPSYVPAYERIRRKMR